jgi:cytidine deaminase
MTDFELANAAIEAAGRAMPGVSGFPVGAALLANDGRVFTGCNVESPSLLQVFCAERVALLSALADGARDFQAIAVHALKRPDITPCGLCRQMLSEFAPNVRVLLVASPQQWRTTDLAALFPEGFAFRKE